MGVDQLHALNLGALHKFARELMWILMWCSVWGTRAGQVQEAWISDSLIVMRSELKLWERRYKRARPTKKVTDIQDITSGHIWDTDVSVFEAQGGRDNVFLLVFA